MHITRAIFRGVFTAVAVLVGLLVGAVVTLVSLGVFVFQRLRGRRGPAPRMARPRVRRPWKTGDVIEVAATEVPAAETAAKHEPAQRN
jgi:hypothetical protein